MRIIFIQSVFFLLLSFLLQNAWAQDSFKGRICQSWQLDDLQVTQNEIPAVFKAEKIRFNQDHTIIMETNEGDLPGTWSFYPEVNILVVELVFNNHEYEFTVEKLAQKELVLILEDEKGKGAVLRYSN